MKILVLAPHVDDGEIGCGGTIAKFAKENIFYVAFSWAEQPELKKEIEEAMDKLGVSNILLYNYPVRNFFKHRQSILEKMIEAERDIKPDLVFLPSTYDTHQDHEVISKEGFRAFKKTSILGYELPWNNLIFTAETFAPLSEEQVAKKVEALACYKSQSQRKFLSEDAVRSLAKTRGVQIDVPYAEAFQAIRWVLK